MPQLPEYETKDKAEASWGGIVGALTVFTGAVFLEVGASDYLALAAAGLAAAVARWGLSRLCPEPQ